MPVSGEGAGRVELVHGDGGQASRSLIEEVFLSILGDEYLGGLDDAAILPGPGREGSLAFTTDSFVVSPWEFPGGDIGKLAVCGTVNDLAACGAEPVWMSAGFILEEGLSLVCLRTAVRSMARCLREAGVRLAACDTKVVERGGGDGLYINTSGIGFQLPEADLAAERVRPGDAVLVSGPVGDHGVAVLAAREGMSFSTPVVSDCAPLGGLTGKLIRSLGDRVRFMRDPTRGGLATVLKEIALGAGCDVVVEEERIPVRREVRAAAEMLGLDPLYLANEGKMVLITDPDAAAEALRIMRGDPVGEAAEEIGRVESGRGLVRLITPLGGTRRLGLLVGDPLPRIC
ncbi:MAG: hydrogenase expression/formation protein HypE [Bacillota bacterium]